MPSVEAYRRLVVTRASGACEYCRLLQDASGVTFHVDHVIPLAAGGLTSFGNLALSCPGCNLSKADRMHGLDSTGAEHAPFNPRAYEPWLLGWHLHFSLDRDTGLVIGLTPTGEATVRALNINSEHRTFARRFQIAAGLIG
jgi:hypothetical protein